MAAEKQDNDPAQGLALHRHFGGFAISGAIAFTVDAILLETGIRWLGLHPLVARVAAIACAMVAGWLSHRTFTFALSTTPSLREFLRYAAAAWMAAALNYAAFATIVLYRPDTPAFIALGMASFFAMIFSYLAMRYAVFWKGRR
ncbi:MAG: GtrA family protein [Hyphomicrobiaceae bacterium]